MATKAGSGINDVIGEKRADILRLAKRHGVYNVRVFGSVARGDAKPDSDIDLVVDGLENAAWGGGRLLIDLQTLLGRRVDLVSADDLHWTIRDKILKEAVPL